MEGFIIYYHVSCRINRLLIFLSNLQAGETRCRCKRVLVYLKYIAFSKSDGQTVTCIQALDYTSQYLILSNRSKRSRKVDNLFNISPLNNQHFAFYTNFPLRVVYSI